MATEPTLGDPVKWTLKKNDRVGYQYKYTMKSLLTFYLVLLTMLLYFFHVESLKGFYFA